MQGNTHSVAGLKPAGHPGTTLQKSWVYTLGSRKITTISYIPPFDASAKMINSYVYLYAKQKQPGCKKCEANQEQHCSYSYKQPKSLISGKAKKILLLE